MAFFNEIRNRNHHISTNNTNNIAANVDTIKTFARGNAMVDNIHQTGIQVLNLARTAERMSAVGTNPSVKVSAGILTTCFKKIQSAGTQGLHASVKSSASEVLEQASQVKFTR